MASKTQKVTVKSGPITVETSFVTTSMEGKAVYFINSRNPRDYLAIALGTMFGACGAAELGESLETVERMIEEAEETFTFYKQLARVLAKRNSDSGSGENPESKPAKAATKTKKIETVKDDEL